MYIIFRGDFEVVRANKLMPISPDDKDNSVEKVKGMIGPKRGALQDRKTVNQDNPRSGQKGVPS